MSPIGKRIAALEAAKPDRWPTWHHIIVDGVTQDEAIDAYGRDRIAPGDGLIVHTIVDPPTDWPPSGSTPISGSEPGR